MASTSFLVPGAVSMTHVIIFQEDNAVPRIEFAAGNKLKVNIPVNKYPPN